MFIFLQEVVDPFQDMCFNIITLLIYNMTQVTSVIAFCRDAYWQKMSCYDKNVATPQAESESAGYVKVKLIAVPLRCSIAIHLSYVTALDQIFLKFMHLTIY